MKKELLKIMKERRSVRSYKKDLVIPEDVLQEILEMSSCMNWMCSCGVKYCQAHSQQNRRQHVHKQQAQNHNHGSSSPISSRTTTKKVVPVDDILKLDIHVNFHSWI